MWSCALKASGDVKRRKLETAWLATSNVYLQIDLDNNGIIIRINYFSPAAWLSSRYLLIKKSRIRSSAFPWEFSLVQNYSVILDGFGLQCSPRNLRFADSNPAKVDEIFEDVKVLSTSPLRESLNHGSWVWDFRVLKELKIRKIDLLRTFNRHIHVLVIT